MPARFLRRLPWLLAALSSAIPAISRAAETDATADTAATADPPAAAASPDAQPTEPLPVPRGFQLGARLGYSVPTGALSAGASLTAHLSDLETATVPIGVDAGYRFSRGFYLGGTLAWGPGISPNSSRTCPAPSSCFRQNAQLRIDARLYLARGTRVGWWAGLGAGWEVAAFAQTSHDSTVTATLTGPVLADLQVGFDWQRGRRAVGPYFGVALAEFLTDGVNPSAAPVDTWIPHPGIHTWITLGLRGSYGPW
jgi:hypothetical protein